ncbi:putative baseplate assembly protein [Geodermatophilus ruber]|uniref:Putative baseplate assembly protein n=1 Tax=Geodermatophilus ruber TaxID=504800 RepID=A0A1I4BJC9_9ACTN|nr:putative baseplate assembly protein [Geodermatophilus ruber]SFK68613.1 putative baseplate assembly protein [Geodermatophilus ruber]
MTLPAPNLDDRRFQDLVDDAKRYVQVHCPQWTDHNVSDPGVTLIETFAMVTDQLFYRLNRVPDRLYVRFLELLGLTFVRPTPATTEVTFWLSAPQEEVVRVPAGTEVATRRTTVDEAITFETTGDLPIVPCAMAALAVKTEDAGEVTDRTDDWRVGTAVPAFSAVPVQGDALLVGLSDAVPRCAVTLRLECDASGAGIRPDDPPWLWEAWNGGYWEACELEEGADGTGGFNQPGDIVLHVPPSHRTSLVAGHRAGWLRCRVVQRHERQRLYEEPPLIHRISAFTIGGTIPAVHQETVRQEVVGLSSGVPGQRFGLARGPVLDGPVVVEVAGPDGWRAWTEAPAFDLGAADAEHFVLDVASGQIVFAPAVRDVGGRIRRLGAVPPAAAPIRVTYRVGGGADGNVLRGAIRTLRSQVPVVTRVENRRAAAGGVNGEDLDSARSRAPAFLRTRDRAVTRADYEYLARDADPRVARVRALTGRDDEPAVIRVVLVPALAGDAARPPMPGDFAPSKELLARVAAHLDERRVLGTRLIVSPPHFQWISVEVSLRVPPTADAGRVRRDALATVHRCLHPLRGGPEGTGWPFGRSVTSGELLAALQRVLGVEAPEAVRLFRVDTATRTRSTGWTNKVELGPGVLPFSFDPSVVEAAT